MSLHGHTKIELKNEKTGEVQVVEKDNMITNAVAEHLNGLYGRLSYSEFNKLLPLYDKMMGGIVLCNETLSEEKTNVGLPTLDKITGYASNDVNSGTDTKRGSRNLTESQKLVNGYKYVWDFTTSQCNGVIAALGLTHYVAGAAPKQVGSVSNTLVSFISSITSELIDYLEKYAVSFNPETEIITCIETINTTTLKVRKYRCFTGMSPLGITDSIGNLMLVSEETINLSTTINSQLMWADSDDNYYYGIYAERSTKEIEIFRISKSDFNIDTGFHMNIQISSSDSLSPINKDTYYGIKYILIANGYLYYILASNNNVSIKLNLNDQSDIIENTLNLSHSAHPILFNDVIHYGRHFISTDLSTTWKRNNVSYNGQNYPFLTGEPDYQTEHIVQLNKSGVAYVIVPYDGYLRIYVGSVYDYLATINNLDTPITKTPDQAMKITYTITEVEDEQ